MHVPATPSHARHDLTLIAGHAAGDLSSIEAASAATLLSSCSACSELHRDLLAIATATRAIPHELRAPRDYRLTAEQAADLRRGSWLRNLLRPFASARSATRPLATAFTTVGLAGLLVAAFVPGLVGTAASGPGSEAFGAGAPAATNGVPAPQAGGPGINVDAGDSVIDVAMGGEGGASREPRGATEDDGRLDAATSPANLLITGSLGLLLIGLAMFGLRLTARRLR